MRKLGAILSKMRIEKNSVLLVKHGSALSKLDVLEQIPVELEKIGVTDIVVMVVDDFSNIRLIPEREMNKYGWFRIEALADKVVKKSREKKDANTDSEPAG
jgi:hypothetical protein